MIVIRITLSAEHSGVFTATSGATVDTETINHNCTHGYQARGIAEKYCADHYGSPWEVVGFGTLPNADDVDDIHDEWVAVIALP